MSCRRAAQRVGFAELPNLSLDTHFASRLNSCSNFQSDLAHAADNKTNEQMQYALRRSAELNKKSERDSLNTGVHK